MRKFIFRSIYSLGDIVQLTAAVRDLHRAYPAQFQTDVRTGFPDLWKHNPYLSPLNDYADDVRTVECDLPLVLRSNESACHCLHGFLEFLNEFLGTKARLTEWRGDIHLSPAEKAGPPPHLPPALGKAPFWLISAGGRFDNTIKWWDARRYQEVVRHFAGRLLFVQVGHARDYHPPLEGVIDLRGKTTVRDLVRLVHHAKGVLCGVTSLMHLAAAVPVRNGQQASRPCVVVAGGRESPSWEAYPGHQFLHTVGTLPCCATGGCWRARTVPLGDGEAHDRPEQLCLDVRHGLPRCMDMITSQDVIRRIEAYLDGGAARTLRPAQARLARRIVVQQKRDAPASLPLNLCTAVPASERFVASLPAYPGGFHGRGLVVCGGGVRLFTNAWVCLNMLRRFGCALPIQLWHLGDGEMDAAMRKLVAPLGVECVDASVVRRRHPVRQWHGWALKPYALLHSPFKEVLLLDADNVPVANPEYLFDTVPYRQTGAVFWPDFGRLGPQRTAWRAFGVPYRNEPEFESGQILLNKEVCWEALNLCLWYNQHSDFFYRFVHGDKETFHMAWRRLQRPYAMPPKPIEPLPGTMCQHDFEGRRLFQHRNLLKWTLIRANKRVRGFLLEDECRQHLERLNKLWDARKSTLLLPRLRPGGCLRAPPRAKSALRLAVCMVSCATRDGLRRRTLSSLARSDWGRAPLLVVLNEARFASPEDNLSHTVWRALRQCLRARPDYILCLQDDLTFNRHLRHNLECWPLLRERQIEFASLYNPYLRELAWDVLRQTTLAESRSFCGAQAILISGRLAQSFLDQWVDAPPQWDMKCKHLALRMRVPILVHSPSLVQHCGRRTVSPKAFGVWDGALHQAEDFQSHWKSPHAPKGETASGSEWGKRRARETGSRRFAVSPFRRFAALRFLPLPGAVAP